jgi:hydroxymethylglutaryl-CoA lyase
VPTERKVAMIERLVAAGITEVEATSFSHVADTVGAAAPEDVEGMCAAIRERRPELSLAVHLHGADERGIVCAVAAVEAGAEQVETSICGLGGPVVRSPGSEPVGNLATEAVVAALARHGVDTGLDPEAVAAAARDVAELLGLDRRAAGVA